MPLSSKDPNQMHSKHHDLLKSLLNRNKSVRNRANSPPDKCEPIAQEKRSQAVVTTIISGRKRPYQRQLEVFCSSQNTTAHTKRKSAKKPILLDSIKDASSNKAELPTPSVEESSADEGEDKSSGVESDDTEDEETFSMYSVLGISAIDKLPDDCLYTIFSFCSNPGMLCTLSRVCRRWRTLTHTSWLWSSLDQDWIQFLESMFFLRNMPFHYASQHLKHTQSLSITGQHIDPQKVIPMCIPHVYPFQRLTRLFLNYMHLYDTLKLVRWLSGIEELRSDNILTHDASQNIVLSSFSELTKLRILRLNFQQPCNHANFAFFMSPNRARPGLPSTIRELQVSNLYDPEEFLLENHHIGHWQRTEDTLLHKYSPLKFLSGLESLSLGRCSAYTARVWRECLVPCSPELRHLRLVGWRSGGRNESPMALEKRRALAEAADVSLGSIQEEVEQAIEEFLGNMKKLRSLELEDFYCGTGIMHGLSRLREKQPYIVGATLYKSYGPPVLSVNDLLNKHIAYCRIEFQ